MPCIEPPIRRQLDAIDDGDGKSARMTSHYIYCDEFGNTGPQLLGVDQPVLVYAFVALPEGALVDISKEVHELYQRESLQLPELKSSILLRSRRGRSRYEAIGRIVADSGAQLFLSVVEKRYQVCVMIMETYLDPELNDWAPDELHTPRFRQRVADACYDQFNDETLMEFLQAVRSDEPKLIASVGGRISSRLRLHPDEFVSRAARLMETRTEHVFRYSERHPELPRNSNLPASQFAAFYPGLELIDAYLDHMDESGTLIRDEDLQFGEVLDLAFLRAQSEGGESYRHRHRLTHLRDCRHAASSQEFGIQVADLVAGIFGRLASLAVPRKGSAKSLTQIARVWRNALAPPNMHYLMVADATLPRVVHSIFNSGQL
jgi:hypothetical protein